VDVEFVTLVICAEAKSPKARKTIETDSSLRGFEIATAVDDWYTATAKQAIKTSS
jgi:hypothetical protein